MYLKRTKVNLKFIFYFIVAIVFVKPRYLEEFNILDDILNSLRFLFSFFIISTYLKRGKISKIFTYFFIFNLILLISTVLNSKDILRAIMYLGINLSIVIMLEEKFKRNNLIAIDALYISYSIMILINFVCLLIYPDGLYTQAGDRGNFLNIDNLLGHILIITIMLSIINIHEKKYIKISYITIVISILTLIITWSVTGIVSIFILVLLFLLKSKFNFINKFLNPKNLLIFVLILFLLIFLNINNKFLGNIITNILKKDLTFSGRTYIWAQFFDDITDDKINFLLGNGIQERNTIYVYKFNSYTHLHNQFYNIMYEGGIVSLISILLIISLVTHRLGINNNNFISKVLTSTLIAFLIFMLMDINRDLEYFTILLVYAYYNNVNANDT